MAAAASPGSPSLDSQEVLVCDICLENYDCKRRQPKFLKCHHSYCEQCLSKVASPAAKTIECPSCRQVTQLPPGGVSALQINFYISHMREMVDQVKGAHVGGCPRHSNQLLSFFCQRCRVAVCKDCTVLDHREADGHDIQDVTEAQKQQRSALQEDMKTATNVMEEVQSHMLYLEAERHNLKVAKDMVIKDVNQAFDRFAKLLDYRRMQLTKEVTDMYNIKQESILQAAGQLQDGLKKLSQLEADSEATIMSKSLAEVVETKDEVQTHIASLKAAVVEVVVGKNNLVFDGKKGADNFTLGISKLGDISAGDGLPSRVHFEIPEMIASIQAMLTMQVYSYGGEKLSGDTIDIMIYQNFESQDKSANCDDTGCFTVKFTPQCSGELRIVATFRSQPIKGAERIVVVTSNNPVETYGSQGDGEGKFQYPRAVCVDDEGSIYVADTGNHVIQKLDSQGKFMHQFRIDGGSANTSTCDLSLDKKRGVLVITETSSDSTNKNPTVGNTVVAYTTDGVLKHRFHSVALKCGLCVATNSLSEIIVSDYLTHSLYMFNDKGEFLRKVGKSSRFNHPSFICVDDNNRMIVSDTNSDCVAYFSHKGDLLKRFGTSGADKGMLRQPFGVAYDGEFVLVVDSGNGRIQVFKEDGKFISMIESSGDPMCQPRGIVLTKDGHVYVADRDNHCIKKYKYK